MRARGVFFGRSSDVFAEWSCWVCLLSLPQAKLLLVRGAPVAQGLPALISARWSLKQINKHAEYDVGEA